MRRLRLVIAFVGALGPAVATAQNVIAPGTSVYIEKMDLNLDDDIRAELTRQKVALKLVPSAADADLLIVGSQTKDVKLTKEQQGIGLSVRRNGTVMVQDKASGSTRWSEDWRLGSYNPKEQRKEASRIVEKLKKTVRASGK